jgi:cation diffusion facilitator family transporter
MINAHRYQVAKKTSLINASVNSLLALFKIMIGYWGHSSALVADGIHSFSDLISDGLVLIAAKAGIKDPDQDHPYGHQRIETLAAIVIAIIFMSAGVLIAYDAIQHIINNTALETPSIAVIIVATVSTLANEWLFRYTLKKGQSIQSNLLITNAWHNRSDAYVSIIVLISVLVTWLGLHYFDAIGAAIIALLIAKMGGKMIWNSINELIDAGVDDQKLAKIKHIIESSPGVVSVHQLRTRLHGMNILVDVHIIVDPKISVSEGHHIGQKMHLLLTHQIKRISDVTIHIDPEDDETCMPSVQLPTRHPLKHELQKCWQTLPGYDNMLNMELHYIDGKLEIIVVMPLNLLETIKSTALELQYQNAVKSLSYIKKISIHFNQ